MPYPNLSSANKPATFLFDQKEAACQSLVRWIEGEREKAYWADTTFPKLSKREMKEFEHKPFSIIGNTKKDKERIRREREARAKRVY